MYKIVFFDIDGTLLNSRRKLPESTISSIHKLQENGIFTAIASARPPFNIQHLLRELNISSYVVYNGGLVVKNGDVIHRHVIDEQLLQSVQETVNKNHDAVVLDYEDGFSIFGEKSAHVKKHYLERSWNVDNDKTLVGIQSTCLAADIFQLELVCLSAEQAEQTRAGAAADAVSLKGDADGANGTNSAEGNNDRNGRNGSYLVNTNAGDIAGSAVESYIRSYPDLTFYPWISYKNVYNAVPKQVSKASGIQKLMQSFGIDPSEAVAFGDGLNDIEMISHVGMGIAMGNGADKLKQAADFVTRHVDDDGIEFGLKHLGLI